ncbi:Hypothetical protein DEACI_3819 [Acididesulfobacillus acetoxydans]|uniref:Uncharacterized protein n=1 Tax=Acididesulfobacillus acetoxydans TaxID=1561005 RepID=A0A8S0XD07_9FIRM|nr:Hypothetical protein DEACI_3819 [Acididesulfobacillus acetoxydans]CEJ05878.1 Hypothetical protein DEACI_0298 [Acididesulfobacillus acetoxydans]
MRPDTAVPTVNMSRKEKKVERVPAERKGEDKKADDAGECRGAGKQAALKTQRQVRSRMARSTGGMTGTSRSPEAGSQAARGQGLGAGAIL